MLDPASGIPKKSFFRSVRTDVPTPAMFPVDPTGLLSSLVDVVPGMPSTRYLRFISVRYRFT
ncbi:hypothetical protein GQ44DRAFT_699749 [Phaeosphaeriaceae sp. PMI808]|nr:hypothetical protein GQ44DRAFT_699749 [Phaeosphaeriaceae sp. PMI808]